jgi:hypothetical protein
VRDHIRGPNCGKSMNYSVGFQTPHGTASIQGFRSTASCDDTKRGMEQRRSKEIIANADYLRQVMVFTADGRRSRDGKNFSKALGGDFQNWNPVAAANYLEALRKKLIPGPPT